MNKARSCPYANAHRARRITQADIGPTFTLEVFDCVGDECKQILVEAIPGVKDHMADQSIAVIGLRISRPIKSR